MPLKVTASFQTTLKVSRYMFRALATTLWILGALISVFYVNKELNQRESHLRQIFSLNFEQSLGYIRHTTDVARELRYIAANRFSAPVAPRERGVAAKKTPFAIYRLSSTFDCGEQYEKNLAQLQSLTGFFDQWHDDFSSVYDLNRIFFVDSSQQCIVDFGIRNQSLDSDSLMKSVQERLQNQKSNWIGNRREESLFWVTPGPTPDSGYLYALTPVYVDNHLVTMMGIEQTIRLDDVMLNGDLPFSVRLLDQNDRVLLQFTDNQPGNNLSHYPDSNNYFGYSDGYGVLLMKKALPPTSMTVVYSLPLDVILMSLNTLIINIVLLNLASAICLFLLTRLFERKIFLPAERNAFQLEENEQFNRKIVASAPVGICILRISDGTNILSNELAHNYLSLLTYEDRVRIVRIICEQQSKSLDVVTGRNHHLQISFVHSRYRNENVAICVLLDVSARVRMEESLQEMANAAEQASQSKSMFLATVSHELRTPLYGIIGNLDLLQTKLLPSDANRLVTAMQNSSSLLLKIISDILDFSKIESEQLKIEPSEFAPREVINHIVSNYLPLVVKKRLVLYCYIDPDVPFRLMGDAVRLQQVLSNLLSNAIKFTDTGCIVFQVACCDDGYLVFKVRDTGVGIDTRAVMKLFDPFFQAGTGVQRHFQGTGLGLAICEKLVSLMDGDITIESELGLGSEFGIRIPLYRAHYPQTLPVPDLQGKTYWLQIRNALMERYLLGLLNTGGLDAQRYEEGQPVGRDDVMIFDHVPDTLPNAYAWVEISGMQAGAAQEIRTGYWLYSTAALHELPVLLQRIYRGEDELPTAALSLPSVSYNRTENGGIRLLVVDDHPINRRLLADQLGSLGYQVVTANDGLDALDVLAKNPVDIVLTDVNMPNMDGYRFTQRLREMGQTLPVIGVTANALAEERQRCLQAGMDNCLSKPVTLDTLQQSLSYYSNSVRQNKAVQS
ncbi:two-component system sensor histidine kinase RcsC [Dickeya dianthicola]|uniref:two-component system sensor histidine kinase RcsC n=1 Tax=Dickeya dianthicola TaxID=204039 RepID=UPI00047A8826|nr:two-component system sensor histidine kinase RcsC [Dickeya dianthicola]MCI4029616.1 two-component system sensor histidine kinase RcsC [Dickeya dianthicola]MCI4174306.1 two-component system sensor histidine kinase RcsC [Dickeya dianthicola]MCI4177434.1 two-component system sensor histidine kinase RcsC [Dickeya dianthicola]MCI4183144.1 two-component system sensor histidine kinase RcsC [Dickeya dianthicola]MCI4193611.1 two-component system sensor histidine kinase RcsC [Dickeya dianthicola]